MSQGWAQTITGRVMLNDTLPASIATLYVPKLGIGTITDFDGYYRLEELPKGNHTIEFSYLGYRTERHELSLNDGQEVTLEVSLKEQPIELNDIYVTPNGEDPALGILRKVIQTAKQNKTRLQNYEASVSHDFLAKNFDIIYYIIPKGLKFIMKTGVKALKMGAVFDLCMNQPRMEGKLSSVDLFSNGKTRHTQEKILSSNPALNGKATEQIFRMAHVDLFDELYVEPLDGIEKQLKKGTCPYRLKGIIEENGMKIDVLEKRSTYEGIVNVTHFYVIEDNWGILRMDQEVNGHCINRMEARNIGGGIYMPVSRLFSFDFSLLSSLVQVKEEKEDAADAGKKKSKAVQLPPEMEQRVRQAGGFPYPFFSTGYSIQYRTIQVKK